MNISSNMIDESRTLRHLILRVVLQQVVCHIFNRILGLLFFLGQLRQGLQHQRHNSLVKVCSDGEGFDFVLDVLNRCTLTSLIM